VVLGRIPIVEQIATFHPKVEARRVKRGYRPFIRYHVLKVHRIIKRRNGGLPFGEGSRLRSIGGGGHRKTYTAERPLFGKLVGSFWWQPHLAGRDTNHIVVKDYKLEG
jgi:hypothetical protein